jgi:hypothetical protein
MNNVIRMNFFIPDFSTVAAGLSDLFWTVHAEGYEPIAGNLSNISSEEQAGDRQQTLVCATLRRKFRRLDTTLVSPLLLQKQALEQGRWRRGITGLAARTGYDQRAYRDGRSIPALPDRRMAAR